MKHLSIILTSIILVVQMFTASAQTSSRIAAITKPGKNHIELRWAPLQYDVWQHGNTIGYNIERVTILRKGKLVEPPERTVITPSPIIVAPQSEWGKYEDDKYAMIAGECIFGESEIEDTGFLPIKAYKKRQDEERRIGFALFSADMSLTAAKLSGLYFKDSNIKPDEKYLYKIYFSQPDTAFADTACAFIGASEYQPLTAPEKPYSYCNKKGVIIWWQQSQTVKFIGYYVEKSSDNGRSYTRITENPIAVTSNDKIYYTDTLANKNSNYKYRIVGVDSFGEESPVSEPVAAKMSIPLDQDPSFTQVEPVNNNSVALTWTYDPDADIKGFKIYRSKSTNSKKILIHSGNDPAQRSFTDRQPLNDNYYYLAVYNDISERLNPFPMYAQLIDSIPPAPPAPPSGYCDSLGIVHLTWHPHPDTDVIGYRIHRSNSPEQNYIMCAKNMVADTFYIDTVNINTLTKNVYYKISAVDSRDNQSALSAVAIVPRYDIVPPIAPTFADITLQKGKVSITINPSPSDDVAKYIFYRKTPSASAFDTIATISATQLKYIDPTALPGEKYHYGIQAVDLSGLCSEISKQPFELPKGKDEEITLKKKIIENVLTLTWNTTGNKPIDYVIIYKQNGEAPLRSFAQVKADNSFTDNTLRLGASCLYYIRLVYTDGTESPLSNEVKVQM